MRIRFIHHLGLILLVNVVTGCAGLTHQQGEANALEAQADTTALEPWQKENQQKAAKLLNRDSKEGFVSAEQEYLYKTLVAELAAYREQYELSATYFFEVAEQTHNVELAERATRIALYAKYYDLGIRAGNLWVKLAPDNPDAHQILGSALLHENRTEEAIVHLETMLEGLEENEEQRLELIANLLEQQPDQESALALMSKLVEKRQQDVIALFTYARLLYAAEKLPESRAVLERVFALQPQHETAVILYANILNQQGETDAALQWLGDKLKTYPNQSDEWRFVYARLLASAEQFDAALTQFQLLAHSYPNNPDVLYALGLLSLQLKKTEDARNYFMDLLENTGQQNLAYYYLGQVSEAEENPDQAIAWYRNVTDGNNFLSAQARIALLLLDQGKLDEALTHLREVPTSTPEEAQQLAQFEAELLIDQKMYTEAIATFDRGLADDPENLELLYARAMTAEKADRIDLLERDLRHILTLDPDYVEAINALGYTLADRTDRHAEAYDLIKQALSMRPDSHYILDSMGWVLYRLGRNDEALAYLRKALAAQYDPEIAAHLGEVLWVSGQQAEAKALWEKAQEAFPDDKQLADVMERFLKP